MWNKGYENDFFKENQLSMSLNSISSTASLKMNFKSHFLKRLCAQPNTGSCKFYEKRVITRLLTKRKFKTRFKGKFFKETE